jgi:hypothetical protein
MKSPCILTVKSLNLNDIHKALSAAGFQTILQPSQVQLPASERREIVQILGINSNADLEAFASVYADPSGIIKAVDVQQVVRRQRATRLIRDPIVLVYENKTNAVFPRVKFAIFNAIPTKILSLLFGANVNDFLKNDQFKAAINDIRTLANVKVSERKLGKDLLNLIVSNVVNSVRTYVDSLRFELAVSNIISVKRETPWQRTKY